MKKQKGFTLIEMVVIIILLAILTINVAPRFLNIQADARGEIMTSVGGAMKSALSLVNSQAIIEGQDKENGVITINGITVPLYYGYPSVDGSDSFEELNEQVRAWLNIDSVSKSTIIANPDAAPFFIDKSSSQNQIYIFFNSAPTSGNRTEYGCQVRYQNSVAGEPTVRVLSDVCE